MNTAELLDTLLQKAKKDEGIKAQLLATREMQNPMSAFCRKCQELGYPLYPMDVIQAGEELYAEIKRSTNGGGENSPMLAGEDDLYEMFFAVLEKE